MVYASYLGSTWWDAVVDVGIDEEGSILVSGYSYSPTFPLTPNAFDRSFGGEREGTLSRLDPNRGLTYSTFLGGSANEYNGGLLALPGKKVVELGPYRLGLIHGYGPSRGLDDRIRAEFQDVDVIVYGHSHRAANYVREGILLFNPGTATGFSSSNDHSVGILEVDETIRGEIISIE